MRHFAACGISPSPVFLGSSAKPSIHLRSGIGICSATTAWLAMDPETPRPWKQAAWLAMVDRRLDFDLWKLQQHVVWHLWYAGRELPRNEFVRDMLARTSRVEKMFARIRQAPSHQEQAQAPGHRLQARSQQVKAPTQPAPDQQVQVPRADGLSRVLIAELNRVGLLLHLASGTDAPAA